MSKATLIIHLLRTNGTLWFLLYLLERLFGWTTISFQKKRISFEVINQLPGFNTTSIIIKSGTIMTGPAKVTNGQTRRIGKRLCLMRFLLNILSQKKKILEIGPGAGRWSVILARLSEKLLLVDITETSIELCRKKLANYSHCQFYKNNGTDLSFMESASIDYVWSYDVFVHIAPKDTEDYLRQLSRILVTNGVGIIHHPSAGGYKGGFRSSVTNDLFCSYVKKYGLEIIKQIDRWGKDGVFSLEKFDDKITVFKKVDQCMQTIAIH